LKQFDINRTSREITTTAELYLVFNADAAKY